MNQVQTYQLGPAAALKSFQAPAFKTIRVSVNMLVPLRASTAAGYALLPSLLSRATRQFPDYTALGRRLARLYGASLGPAVSRAGGFQVLTLSAGGIAGRYAFGGEDMFAELTGLLLSALLDPLTDSEGLFPQEGFLQEKRQQLEQKDAERSDKILYARQSCHRLIFQGQPAGLDRLGAREEIEALGREGLAAAWKSLLREARFEIFALGDCRPDVELFREKFAGLGSPLSLGPARCPLPEKAARAEEVQPLAQSKLVMGFRVQAEAGERLLFQLVSAVLGEPASSKLFLHVREEQGLCYYCDSSFSWLYGCLFVESGVETKDLDRAEEAVLAQLAALQRGELTEEELESAKLYLLHGLRTVRESLYRVEGWYLSRAFDHSGQTPEQAGEQLMKYTRQDVVWAANRLVPAGVFRLKGSENGWS